MNNILILLSHPDLKKSVANKALFEAAKGIDGVTILDIYKEEFSVETYREPFDACDILVFQFPLYWGSAPARLKEWSDRIFFSLIDGMAGAGKKIMVATTAGAPKSSFAPDGFNLYEVKTLMAPYHLQANYSGMGWIPPFVVYDMENEELAQTSAREGAKRYRELLIKLVNEKKEPARK
ncbi:MAG: hypothetical protein CSA13_02260 [Clostridiales bacterium]|nr:MAG: hypothetical protein CSA13_02260 [Clostridiales bacterium]